nr:L,D-transpeptidase [Limosilactobacillus oris]
MNQGSHGCIRLSIPDAYWIMHNVPTGTRVVIDN